MIAQIPCIFYEFGRLNRMDVGHAGTLATMNCETNQSTLEPLSFGTVAGFLSVQKSIQHLLVVKERRWARDGLRKTY
jgi:hypothetical protein